MRLHQFGQWLDQHILVIEQACLGTDKTQLRTLSELAQNHSSKTVKAVASAIETVEVKNGSGTNCRQLSDTINAMVGATREIGKADAVRSLDAFAQALSKRKDETFSELILVLEQCLARTARRPSTRSTTGSLNEEDIAAHVHDLESALGDEIQFVQVFRRIKNDKNVRAQDAKNISKKFVGKSGKSKADAFRLIYERHSSLLESRARAKSTGGRSAA